MDSPDLIEQIAKRGEELGIETPEGGWEQADGARLDKVEAVDHDDTVDVMQQATRDSLLPEERFLARLYPPK